MEKGNSHSQAVDQLASLNDILSRNFNFRRNAGQNHEPVLFLPLVCSGQLQAHAYTVTSVGCSSRKKLAKTILAIVAH